MSIQNIIQEKLIQAFSPSWLEIENESHRHSSGRGAESHFKITLVSEKFAPMRAVARHRAIYECLSEELAGGVHALALHTYTQEEWTERGEVPPSSTNCVGKGQ